MLKKLLSKIVKAAITIGERRLDTIGNPLLKRLALIFIAAGEAVILALLDSDQNNEAQLIAVLHSNAASVIKIGGDLGRSKLSQLKDTKLSEGITLYLNGVEEVLSALVDSNPDNEAQIKEIWQRRKLAMLEDSVDIATDKLSALIRKHIKDQVIANLVIEVVQSLDDLVKQP